MSSYVPLRVDARTDKSTYAIINVEPNHVKIVGFVVVTVLITPTPPSLTGSFDNITITLFQIANVADNKIYVVGVISDSSIQEYTFLTHSWSTRTS